MNDRQLTIPRSRGLGWVVSAAVFVILAITLAGGSFYPVDTAGGPAGGLCFRPLPVPGQVAAAGVDDHTLRPADHRGGGGFHLAVGA